MREVGFNQAVNEALAEEMARDTSVFVMGEDVRIGLFGATRGLVERFGPDRVRDTPISEAVIAGAGVGAALAGLRPVVEIEFASFLSCCWDQVCNQAAKLRYMSGGQSRLPLTIRCVYGAMGAAAAQHSTVVYPQLLNVPGLKIVVPSGVAEVKGLLKAAIRDDNPVVVFESGRLGSTRGPVPDGDVVLPLGRGTLRRPGGDAAVIAIGAMVPEALAAAETLARERIEIAVWDPCTLVPLDVDGLLGAVRPSGRVVIADEGHRRGGAAADLAAVIAEEAFESLRAPIRRAAALDVPIPFSPPLERFVLPDAATIAAAVRAVCA